MSRDVPNIVIASIPHSGSRTLAEHLGVVTWTHFGSEVRFTDYTATRRRKVAAKVHIPIRNPMDLSRSWAERGKPIAPLLDGYREMFAYLARESPMLWQMELLPGRMGSADKKPKKGGDVEEYQSIIMGEVMAPQREFFTRLGYEICP